MPIYEYRCQDCNKKFSTLVSGGEDRDRQPCPKCNGANTQRLVSRFARLRTEDDRVDDMADSLDMSAEPESPSQMREMMKEMGRAMDDDMSDDMEEMFEADMEGKLDDEED